MNTNFLFETILILLAILASNGFIYSLTFFNINKKNSPENISVIRNSSEKNALGSLLLIGSNPLRLTSSESTSSQTLSMTSSESTSSQTLTASSSATNVSEDIFDDKDLINLENNEGIMSQTHNSILSDQNGGTIPSNLDILDQTTSLDSLTLLNSQTLEQWREIVKDLHDLPINTPANILQQVKFEELNILYSQDIILYSITQTELRLIIELIPAMELFNPDINHFILTIMSFYHL